MLPIWAKESSVWKKLKDSPKPIVLYGMGNGAQKILDVCDRQGIEIADIFASDEFVRGHSFAGYQVKTLSEIQKRYQDFFIVLAFGTFRPEMMQRIKKLSKKYELVAPDVPVVGEGLFTPEFATRHQKEICKVYESLADEYSKLVYEKVLEFKITGNIHLLFEITSPKEEMYTHLLKLSPQSSYLDLGAYNGDTVSEFTSYAPAYHKIYAVEPDERNCRKLQRNIEKWGLSHIEIIHGGAWEKEGTILFSSKGGRNSAVGSGVEIPAVTVDGILGGKQIDYIKMDVEGSEFQAIRGAGETLKKYGPKLLVSAYHRNDDLWNLPLEILRFRPDYRLYLRHFP